jgi:hypothetical protein
MVGANIIEFSGVNGSAPIILGTGKNISNTGGQCVTTNSVTTTLAGAALYALSSGHYYGTPISMSSTLATQSWAVDNISSSVAIRAGYKDSVAAAALAANTAYTIGFTYQWCSPAAVLPIAIVPYRAP